MSGQGKYTKYAPPKGVKNDMMNKLFPGTPRGGLDESKAKEEIVKLAIEKLTRPSKKELAGDGSGPFPDGVDLTFGVASGTAPDTASVKHQHAGDPANPYTPDITSPGEGKTAGTDKTADPGISYKDVKPNAEPGSPGTGTRSPS